jgi:carotenoid cleavage dioxygenase-like enzyme
MRGVEDGCSAPTEVHVPDLPVFGAVPRWLSGTLARTDGGTLHRFGFSGGEVSYRTRRLDPESPRCASGPGPIDFAEFTVDPCRALFSRFGTRYRVAPNPVATVLSFSEWQWARQDPPMAVEFAPEALVGVGLSDEQSTPVVTSHPHHAPLTGDQLDYVLRFGERSEHRVYRRRQGARERELLAAIPAGDPGYLHSFAVTERFVVLVVYPFVVDSHAALSPGRPFIDNHRWRPELGTRFIVVDQEDGALVGDYRTDAFFAFHHINARDAGHRVVLDICSYPNADVVDTPVTGRANLPPAYPTRYEIDLVGGAVHTRRLADEPFELPKISYRAHNGGDYRYAYGMGVLGCRREDAFDQLVKLDVQSGDTRLWREPGSYPGEPVFVPAPRAGHEDDGVVLSVVLDPRTGHAGMVVLDAHTFEELARVDAPQPARAVLTAS